MVFDWSNGGNMVNVGTFILELENTLTLMYDILATSYSIITSMPYNLRIVLLPNCNILIFVLKEK